MTLKKKNHFKKRDDSVSTEENGMPCAVVVVVLKAWQCGELSADTVCCEVERTAQRYAQCSRERY